ncbi:nucleotidyltransferase domain-containing protein [Dysgonomonas sp. GY75]|uniref:nucleotidyltransferase domain-containing protein n=1 Tax=Dysgonomonas sp. GY75 TaxID=2780419 RepID=UPI001883A238|nr:nucleotidyltransferase domain-containing protein [Dysgonomonas sp. GY75]MBF0649280.1 nucleotidyltransferase domain-containing protein [Dysgonomonas sp. GY75]
MKATIQQKLTEIEKAYGIKILYSCESGSRAWGFPSPDSDYDVRFIYSRPIEEYLTIKPKKDHLSFPINDELDIYGWDISKVLHLITKSNTTPFEWLQSPVVYKEDTTFKDELWTLCQSYFYPRNNIHHYLGIARGAMETMQGEDIKIKKLFYVLRPMLAAWWCAEKNTIAPMSIYPLMDLLTDDLRKKVLSLIELKSTANESYLIEIDQDIKTWIDRTFDYCMEVSLQLAKKDFDQKISDEFFRKAILI